MAGMKFSDFYLNLMKNHFFPKIFFEDISIVSFGLKMLKKNKNDTRSFDSKFLFAENSFESNFDGHDERVEQHPTNK